MHRRGAKHTFLCLNLVVDPVSSESSRPIFRRGPKLPTYSRRWGDLRWNLATLTFLVLHLCPVQLPRFSISAREHSVDRRNVHLWREQSNIAWPIHSSAYRRLIRTNQVVNESSMQYYEE